MLEKAQYKLLPFVFLDRLPAGVLHRPCQEPRANIVGNKVHCIHCDDEDCMRIIARGLLVRSDGVKGGFDKGLRCRCHYSASTDARHFGADEPGMNALN